MNQDQIEAVRAELVEYDREVFGMMAAKALRVIDHLTKANEELRAEVERLQTTLKAFNNGMPAMTTKEVADENADLRATIDRLTHDLTVTGERYHATIKERARAVAKLTMTTDELETFRHDNAAMQEAIDKAVRRADGDLSFSGYFLAGHITEPLRPFATKPKPEAEVDPLVEALREVLPTHNREVSKLWAANLRTALAARGGRVVFDGREG